MAKEKKTGKSAPAGDKSPGPIGPPMYARIEALSAARHAGLRLTERAGYGEAAGMSSIVLGASEFAAAARSYPIVFSDQEDGAMPFAVTGYASGSNAYVDENGQWRADAYIPAYVRRYPFIFIESEGGSRLTLAIDADSAAISQNEGNPIYGEDGKPGPVAARALEFCKAYKAEMDRTRRLVSEIAASGILVSRRADVVLPGGQRAAIGGFSIVDEARLNELDDAQFLSLRSSGALVLIYCHLLSMQAWRNVLA